MPWFNKDWMPDKHFVFSGMTGFTIHHSLFTIHL